jgi:hypothetical protein
MKWLVTLMLSATAFADTSAPARRSKSTRHVVMSADEARACFGGNQKFVTPSAPDIKRLEAGLPRALGEVAADKKNRFAAAAAGVLKELDQPEARFYVGTPGFVFVHGYRPDVEIVRNCPHDDDDDSASWHIEFDVKRGAFDHFEMTGGL